MRSCEGQSVTLSLGSGLRPLQVRTENIETRGAGEHFLALGKASTARLSCLRNVWKVVGTILVECGIVTAAAIV